MHYRSLSDLTGLITGNLHRIPSDVDLVVGIPRSGILPAITVALMLNLRYADLDRFLDGRLAGAGCTKQHRGLIGDFSAARHILVFDDSLNRGDAMREARERLRHLSGEVKLTFAAAYVVPDGADEVDIALEILPLPRIFEWNFIHHVYLERACVDIDGVLCVDPSEDENDDGAAYLQFLTGAVPLYRPTRRIGCLVTSRLEKYRPQTEAWLERHGVVYDKLVMLDLPTAEERRRLGIHGKFKGEVYRDSKAILFIESEQAQAMAIAQISGKPVLSIEGQEIVSPGAWSRAATIQKLRNVRVHAKLSDSPLVNPYALKRRMRRLLPPAVYEAVLGVCKTVLKGNRGAKPEASKATPPVPSPAAGITAQVPPLRSDPARRAEPGEAPAPLAVIEGTLSKTPQPTPIA
jgi:uncharacterized HAD superfamily protein